MTLYVVIGPPAAGKSTWVLARAQPGDITIDYDRLANALTGSQADPHDHPGPLRAVTFKAREAAIGEAMRHTNDVDVYVIHSMPSLRILHGYKRQGAHIQVVDPGRATVLGRCTNERPRQMLAVVERWYDELLPSLTQVLGSAPPTVTPHMSPMVSTPTVTASRDW